MSFFTQLEINAEAHRTALSVADANRETSDSVVFTAFRSAYGMRNDAFVSLQKIQDMWTLVETIEDVDVFANAIKQTAIQSYNGRHPEAPYQNQ